MRLHHRRGESKSQSFLGRKNLFHDNNNNRRRKIIIIFTSLSLMCGRSINYLLKQTIIKLNHNHRHDDVMHVIHSNSRNSKRNSLSLSILFRCVNMNQMMLWSVLITHSSRVKLNLSLPHPFFVEKSLFSTSWINSLFIFCWTFLINTTILLSWLPLITSSSTIPTVLRFHPVILILMSAYHHYHPSRQQHQQQ